MEAPRPAELREALSRDGFVRMPKLLSGREIELLRETCSRSVDLTRAGNWPFFRSLPKQFPPWTDDASQGIWGVQHLLHPEMPGRTVFALSYFHDAVVETVTSLLDCSKDDLVMELYNLLVRPDHDFALRWHRDDIGPDVTAEEESRRLREPMVHAQWNLALYDDASLVVVPGSHLRARTDIERHADPFKDDMPGQKVVELAAGDIVFYNNNILHRGVYDAKTERCTLHGSMGLGGVDSARSRNILQHGLGDWAERCSFSEVPFPEDKARLAEAMRRRLITIGTAGHSGFSQEDSEQEPNDLATTVLALQMLHLEADQTDEITLRKD